VTDQSRPPEIASFVGDIALAPSDNPAVHLLFPSGV